MPTRIVIVDDDGRFARLRALLEASGHSVGRSGGW
jgi:hypothetical protein